MGTKLLSFHLLLHKARYSFLLVAAHCAGTIRVNHAPRVHKILLGVLTAQ